MSLPEWPAGPDVGRCRMTKHIDSNAHLVNPASAWPETLVLELTPRVAAALPRAETERTAFVCEALRDVVGWAAEELRAWPVGTLPSGSAAVCLRRDGRLARRLHAAAMRRGTSPAEIVHAAVLSHLES